jgi:dTDP-4-amino-4,6-dideoxygalactose transaminase
MLSFCQNKIITTGDGGALITDSREIYEKLKLIRSHGRLETQDYFSSTEYMDYVTLGYNFRMSNIVAALGIAQLKKIDKIIEMRRENAEYLATKLKDIEEIIIPNHPKEYYHVYQMFTVKVNNHRDDLMKYLAEEGIMTKVYFSPVHLTHFYKNELGYVCKLPVTEQISNQVLSLPLYPTLTREEIDFIIDKIKSFFEVAR